MSSHTFENTYDLSSEQLEQLDKAEELMVKNHLGAAEELLLKMLEGEEGLQPSSPSNILSSNSSAAPRGFFTINSSALSSRSNCSEINS